MSNVVIPLYVSENGLQDFIDSMVEEIVLNDKSFGVNKAGLEVRCKNADVTGIDYEILVDDLNEFLHNLQLGLGSTDGMAAAMSMAFALGDAGKCFVSQDKVDEIAYKVE